MVKKSRNKTTLSKRLLRVSRANTMVLAGFLLVFAGAGTWFVSRSEAASGCAGGTYAEYQAWGSLCVKHIQHMLTYIGYGPYSSLCSALYSNNPANQCDGEFGPQTKADVVHFQYMRGISGGNGVVGSRTWRQLCALAHAYGLTWDYNGASCAQNGY